MIKAWRGIFLSLLLALFITSASEPSYAELLRSDGTILMPADINCDFYPQTDGRYFYGGGDLGGWFPMKRVGLIQRLVSCVRDKIEVISSANFATISTVMSGIVFVGLIIYMAFFLIKVMFGGIWGRSVKDTMVVLLTMVFINVFATGPDLQYYINVFTATQHDLVNVVTSSLADNPLDICKNDVLGFDLSIWRRMDCILVYVLGANPDIYFDMSVDPFHLSATGIRQFNPTLFVLDRKSVV